MNFNLLGRMQDKIIQYKNGTDLELHKLFKKYFTMYSCLEVEYYWLMFNKQFEMRGLYKIDYLFRKRDDAYFGDVFYLNGSKQMKIVQKHDKINKTEHGRTFLTLYNTVDISYIDAKQLMFDTIKYIDIVIIKIL